MRRVFEAEKYCYPKALLSKVIRSTFHADNPGSSTVVSRCASSVLIRVVRALRAALSAAF